MFSRISPFKSNLLKKELKLGIGAIVTVGFIIFMMTNFAIMDRVRMFNDPNITNFNLEREISTILNVTYNATVDMLMIALPFFIAIISFGIERSRKSLEISLAGPYSRHEIYFNKIVFGILGSFFPIFINGIIMIIIKMTTIAGQYIEMKYILIDFMLGGLGKAIMVYGFVTLIGCLTGNGISQGFNSCVFSVLPIGVYGLLMENLRMWGVLSRSMYSDWLGYELIENITPFMNYVFSIEKINAGYWNHSIKLGLLGLAFLAFGKIFFDLNPMEKNGEVLMFKETEGFFKFGVLICSILLGGLMFVGMFGLSDKMVFLGNVIGGVLGFYVPKYLIGKAKNA